MNLDDLTANQEAFDRLDLLMDTDPMGLRDFAWELVCELVKARKELVDAESCTAQTVENFADWIEDHKGEVADLAQQLAKERTLLQDLARRIVACDGMSGAERSLAENLIVADAHRLLAGAS